MSAERLLLKSNAERILFRELADNNLDALVFVNTTIPLLLSAKSTAGGIRQTDGAENAKGPERFFRSNAPARRAGSEKTI
jgi:hypothetical protein